MVPAGRDYGNVVPGLPQAAITGLKTRGTSTDQSGLVAHQKRVARELLDLCWRSGLSMAICGMEGEWL